MNFNTINSLPLALLTTLNNLKFHTMTPIQQKAIEPILEKKDILAQSKTGSGKTLAFGLPCIIATDTTQFKPQTLIITPTRELAEQIAIELRKISTYKENLKIVTLYGGVPLRSQAQSLAKGSHILIGTAGRIQDHLEKETLTLDSIETLVLDEADRMLNMGFYDDIVKIASNTPQKRQTLLFSATFALEIEKLAKTLLKNPLTIKIDTIQEKAKIEEISYACENKFQALKTIISSYKPSSLLIFCNTKIEVIELTTKLIKEQHATIDIHGDLDQRERNESVILFSNGSKNILVATDVASRGLDIKNIAMVMNYDLPFEKEIYTHRIGRTGRAEAKGIAISLYHAKQSEKYDDILSQTQKKELKTLRIDKNFKLSSQFDTICLNGGKKTKLSAGDILGTLCKEIGINNTLIGKINITQTKSYIALDYSVTNRVMKALKEVRIKKKKYSSWLL